MLNKKERFIQQITNSNEFREKIYTILYNNQTYEEKQTGETHENNTVGFNSLDAKYLTTMYKKRRDNRTLINKLKKYWRQCPDKLIEQYEEDLAQFREEFDF